MACNQRVTGVCAQAEGFSTLAEGNSSHAEGYFTTASGPAAHSEGSNTTAGGDAAHAEGLESTTSAPAAHAEGYRSTASGNAAHAEGTTTIASGSAAHAEGDQTIASGNAAHAEGWMTVASLDTAHAEGAFTESRGESAHAEGLYSQAIGHASHAEGYLTVANSDTAHAEGSQTAATGVAAHSEGFSTTASGNTAHAEGIRTVADAETAHAEGLNTQTGGYAGAHIMGRFGTAQEAYSWFIANGTSEQNTGIGAKWLASTGSMYVDGSFVPSGADYAELFETVDGTPIAPGYFVTTKGRKIQKATSGSYVAGVTSASPAIIGDSAEMRWHGKYKTDKWGAVEMQEVILPAEVDNRGKVIVPERREMQPVLNPDYNPELAYTPRRLRPEWVAVGMLGKLLVRDDGTCEVDGFCAPSDDGIATKAERGFRVLERTSEDQILILFVSGQVL